MRIPRSFRPGREAAMLGQTAAAAGQEIAGRTAQARAVSGAARAVAGATGEIGLDLQRRRVDALGKAADAEVAAATTRATADLDAIANEREITPEDLAAARQTVQSSIAGLSEIPRGYEESLNNYLTEFDAQNAARAQELNYARSVDTLRNSAFTSIGDALDAGNYALADTLYKSTVQGNDAFSVDEQRRLSDRILLDKESDTILRLVADGKVDEARARIDNYATRQNVSGEMRRQLTGRGNSMIARAEAEIAAQERQAAAERAEALQEGFEYLYTGATVGYDRPDGTRQYLSTGEIDALYAAEQVTAEEYQKLYSAAQTREERNTTKFQVQQRMAAELGNETVAFDGKEQNAYDEYIEEALPDFRSYQSWDLEDKALLANHFSKGAVPGQVRDLLSMGLSTNDAAVTGSAVEMARALQAANPTIWNAQNIRTQSFYAAVGRRMDGGLSAGAAVEESKMLDQLTNDERQFADDVLKEEYVDNDDHLSQLEDFIDDDPFLDTDEGAAMMLPAYLQSLREANQLMRGRDVQAAARVAYSRARARFGETQVFSDDPELVMYPAEVGPGGQRYSPTDVRADLAEAMGVVGGVDPDRFDYRLEAVGSGVLVATSATGTNYPTRAYRIMQMPKNPDDIVRDVYVTDASGFPVLYSPDYPALKQLADERRDAVVADIERRAEEFEGRELPPELPPPISPLL